MENDHCKLSFDDTAEKGEKQWFIPKTAKVDSDLLDLLLRLRSFFETRKLYTEGKPWTGCTVKRSLKKMKIKIDFKYS